MTKIKEILRLRLGKGLSERQVARCCQVSRSTVSEYEKRTEAAGLKWPIPEGMDLEEALMGGKEREPKRKEPNWSEIHREQKRKGVTLKLLWEEYKAKRDRLLKSLNWHPFRARILGFNHYKSCRKHCAQKTP